MPKAQPEYNLQVAVCQYLRVKYPHVMFRSDVGSQLKLTMGQATRNKAIQPTDFKCPDIIIYRFAHGFGGLFLELKVESPWKKNGELRKDNQLEAQWRDIKRLRLEGYHANFYWTFDQCKNVLDWYLGR